MTLGQIRHATLEMNDYYPLIARAVERLDRSTGEARRAVYERARKAVAQLRSNQPALLDADITKERLALEEAIRKVEAEAARKSPPETRAEPRSAAPSEGMPDSDKIQTRDHLQPASPDRDDRPPALPNRQAPIFLPTASDDHHNADIQAVAIGGAYGADHYYDDVPGSRWRGGLLVVMAVLALAMLAGTFAYRAMFGGYTFPALPPIVIAGTGPNNIVRNNSDTRRSNSSQTSVTSAGWSEKLQPIDIREAPKTVPRVISNIPISSRPSAGPVAPAPAATAAALDPPVASALDQHVAPSVPPSASAPAAVSAPALSASPEPSETAAVYRWRASRVRLSPALAPPVLTAAPVPPPASAPAPVSASSEPSETAAVALAAPMPALAPPMLTAAPVPPPASAPAPVSASSEPSETAAVAAAAPMPALAPPMLTAAPVPPPASAPVPVPASSEPSETAAVARGCAYARSCSADAYSSTCPTARLGSGACTGFLGAERDWGGRAGCAYARSRPTGAYSSTCPAACLGSGACIGFLGAERDCDGPIGCARAACAFARSCRACVHGSAARLGSGDGAGFLGAEGDSDGHGCPRWAGGNKYILAACARSTQRDTCRSKAERCSGVSGRES